MLHKSKPRAFHNGYSSLPLKTKVWKVVCAFISFDEIRGTCCSSFQLFSFPALSPSSPSTDPQLKDVIWNGLWHSCVSLQWQKLEDVQVNASICKEILLAVSLHPSCTHSPTWSIKTCIRYIKYEMSAKMQLNMPTCATGLDEHHSPQLTYAPLLWLYCCSFFSGQSLWLYRQTQREKHIHGQCPPPSASGISVMHWAGNVHRRHLSSCLSKGLLLCKAIVRLIHRKWNYIC